MRLTYTAWAAGEEQLSSRLTTPSVYFFSEWVSSIVIYIRFLGDNLQTIFYEHKKETPGRTRDSTPVSTQFWPASPPHSNTKYTTRCSRDKNWSECGIAG